MLARVEAISKLMKQLEPREYRIHEEVEAARLVSVGLSTIAIAMLEIADAVRDQTKSKT